MESSSFKANFLFDDTHLRACLLLSFFIFASAFGLDFQACKSREEEILRVEPLLRLKRLGNISDSHKHLQRTFLSEASLEAGILIQSWMEEAGMTTWVDDIGNVHGRLVGGNASAPALLLGSHLDTVIDAGLYDGALGIVTAIAAVKALHVSGDSDRFPRPIEVIAFSDEEGVRFQSTFLGSAAVAGNFPLQLLRACDKRGITLEAALKARSFDGTAQSLLNLKYNRDSVWGYVEVHIEQGPVLEKQKVPLGVVGAIAGQTRLTVVVKGSQGHAGTVPMVMRRDPMTAAAAAIVTIEHICKNPKEYLNRKPVQNQQEYLVSEGALVCTVGEITSWPGASNVIPAEVIFTVDIRAEDDYVRSSIVLLIAQRIQEMCHIRQVLCDIQPKHEAIAVHFNSEIQERLQKAAAAAFQSLSNFTIHQYHQSVPTLVSGAGHDAMMMAQLTKVGMLFVRSIGGISHSPAEHVLEEDVWAASMALKVFLDNELASTMIC